MSRAARLVAVAVLAMLALAGAAQAGARMPHFRHALAKSRVLRDAQYFPVNQDVEPLKALQPVSPHLAGLKETFIDDEMLYATHGKIAGLLKKHFG